MKRFDEIFGNRRGNYRRPEDEVSELIADRASKNGSGLTAGNITVALGYAKTLILEALETAESELRICCDGNGRWHPLQVPIP